VCEITSLAFHQIVQSVDLIEKKVDALCAVLHDLDEESRKRRCALLFIKIQLLQEDLERLREQYAAGRKKLH
jgi:hypothetical protein